MSEVLSFFRDYQEAFTRGAAVIATFYGEPCITARGGKLRLNATRKDCEAFFATVDTTYRERGFRSGRMLSFFEQSAGTNSALATITWAYDGADGKTLWESTFTYSLYRFGGAWKILLQTMHDRAA
jgi:hypothetical protein